MFKGGLFYFGNSDTLINVKGECFQVKHDEPRDLAETTVRRWTETVASESASVNYLTVDRRDTESNATDFQTVANQHHRRNKSGWCFCLLSLSCHTTMI